MTETVSTANHTGAERSGWAHICIFRQKGIASERGIHVGGDSQIFDLRIFIRAPVFISRVLFPPPKWVGVCTHHTPSPCTDMGTDTGACWGVSARQSGQPLALHTLGQRSYPRTSLHGPAFQTGLGHIHTLQDLFTLLLFVFI